MLETLDNGVIRISVDSHGAELHSIQRDGVEYLWYGDPAFWGRHAPVLFPFVGLVKDKEYRYAGKSYPMGQHGFARDMEFTLTEKTEKSIFYTLKDNEESYAKFPFHFELTVGYELEEDKVKTIWKVSTPDDLHFSIGGHPAFLCPINGEGDWSKYQIELKKDGQVVEDFDMHSCVDGLITHETTPVHAVNGRLIPSVELFSGDALVVEEQQLDEVSLIDPAGKPYLTVTFDTPLVGIWAPVGKEAPFICIEPWYGRADFVDFTGSLEERTYGRHLVAGDVFEGGFTLQIPKRG